MDGILPPLGLIAGPTASGKSALALMLAERIGGTIVNADASQVYADLRILSARPSPADEARVPHRLFGHVDGACPHNVAAWANEARDTVASVHAAGGIPILVGGSGLYLSTLLDGIAPIPPIDPEVRAAVRALPVAVAHAALSIEDPAAAARLSAADTTRVARALEVVRATGRPLAGWHGARIGGIGASVTLSPLVLMPDADALARRIDRRLLAMIDAGAADEIDALVARRLDPASPVMRAIGVSELIAWRRGERTRDEAVARAQLASRRYAKRQRTWFRHQPPSDWPLLSKIDAKESENAILFLSRRLTR